MPWSILLDLRVFLAALVIAVGLYAALQRIEKEHCQATFAQFRADVESEAAKAKVRAAQEAAQQAQHAQEALDDLQTRIARLNSAYDRLRDSKPGSSPVPRLSSAAPVFSSCPGKPGESDAAARFLVEVEGRVTAILKTGDLEIAKLVELYRLDQANAAH